MYIKGEREKIKNGKKKDEKEKKIRDEDKEQEK